MITLLRFIALALLLALHTLHAQERINKKLQRSIEELVKGFKGQVGIYVKNLNTGRVAYYNADTIFPTASMIKIPIMIGVMDKIQKGELSYDQELVYTDSLLYAGVDILGSYKNGEKTSIGRVMMLMLTMSDNTASLWLQSLAGTGTRINAILDSNGFQHTRVNSRTPGRENNRTQYGWGQTTPREMVGLMEKIYKGQMVSPEASGKMLRLLGRNYWDGVAISQIPPTVFVASKNGAVNQSRSETLLVMSPHGPYAFSIITKNNEDQRWTQNNEAWVMIRKLSRLLWEHFDDRKSRWTPPTPVEGTSGVL
ncbi:MAG TPA: serine hydrolase [Chitinophagaceae bacterium]|nr:serine hydrolase [Chitinophagaceae bacterium]